MSQTNVVAQLVKELNAAKDSLADAEAAIESRRALVDQLSAAHEAMKAIFPADAFNVDAHAKSGSRRARPAAKKAGVKAPAHSDLPTTDEQFWLGCFEAGKSMKTGDIIAAAATKAGVPDSDAERIAVLKQRMPGYLVKLAEAGRITSEGDRNKRTYQLAA